MKNWMAYIHHMQDAAVAVQRFAAHDRSDEMVLSAIHRQLEILGEAANRVPKSIQQQHPLIPWRQMIDLRNILIHLYDGLDEHIVNNVIDIELPKLRQQLETLLANEA